MARPENSRNKRIALSIAIAAALGATATGCGSSPAPIIPLPVGSGVIGTAGCLPLALTTGTQPQVGFTGTNIYFDSINVVGGTIPQTAATMYAGQTFGQVVTGGGAIVGGSGTLQANGPYGQVIMAVTPTTTTTTTTYQYGYNPYSNSQIPANVSGTVLISQTEMQNIMMSYGGYNYGYGGYNYGYQTPMPTQTQPQICVSGVAFEMGHSGSTLYGGSVFLYLNNTMHGAELDF